MEKGELLSIMKAVEAQEKEREADARQEHEQLREEIRNKNLEDINVLRITLDRYFLLCKSMRSWSSQHDRRTRTTL